MIDELKVVTKEAATVMLIGTICVSKETHFRNPLFFVHLNITEAKTKEKKSDQQSIFMNHDET